MTHPDPVVTVEGVKIVCNPILPVADFGDYIVPDPAAPAFTRQLLPVVAIRMHDPEPPHYTIAQQRGWNQCVNMGRQNGLRFRHSPGHFAGQTLWIIGNGPSAAGAVDRIAAPRELRPAAAALNRADAIIGRYVDRRPKVLAINGAIRQLDAIEQEIWWLVGDDFGAYACHDKQAEEKRERAAWMAFAENAAKRPHGAEGLFHVQAHHDVASSFTDAGGKISWWMMGHGGQYGAPWEEFLSPLERVSLPRLCFTRTSLMPAMHLALWLGFHEVCLIGCEMSAEVDGEWYAAEPAGTEHGRASWGLNAKGGEDDETDGGHLTTNTVDGRAVRTFGYWEQAHNYVDTMGLWLRLSGLRVVDYSNGLRFRHIEQEQA